MLTLADMCTNMFNNANTDRVYCHWLEIGWNIIAFNAASQNRDIKLQLTILKEDRCCTGANTVEWNYCPWSILVIIYMFETHISKVYSMILVTVSIIVVREFIGRFKIFLQKYIINSFILVRIEEKLTFAGVKVLIVLTLSTEYKCKSAAQDFIRLHIFYTHSVLFVVEFGGNRWIIWLNKWFRMHDANACVCCSHDRLCAWTSAMTELQERDELLTQATAPTPFSSIQKKFE